MKFNIYWFKYFLLLFFLSNNVNYSASAQIIPDQTLGSENSRINSVNELEDLIEGGAIREDNLFHSFTEFSVNEGLTVNFANPEGIANIFSRVTGNNVSEVLGNLRVDGAANLFLINPNGILFGENAVINLNGSFLATTAETIDFENGSEFSASAANEPFLTINFPVGLGFGNNPGDIRVNGTGSNIENSFNAPDINELDSQFNIQSNHTLAFIGGDVVFNGAIITVESGKIEIGSVSNGNVQIGSDPQGIKVEYQDIPIFQDINFNSASVVATQNAGDISVNSDNLTVTELSLIASFKRSNELGGNISINSDNSVIIDMGIASSLNFGEGEGGDISVNSDNLIVTNESNFGSGNLGTGTGGDVFVNSNNLIATDGGNLGSVDFIDGIGGDVFISSDSITVAGVSFSGFPFSSLSSSTVGSGRAGNLSINTSVLSITNGAEVSSSTLGSGSAGTIKIDSLKSIFVEGVSSGIQKPSQIVAGGNDLEIPRFSLFDPNQSLGISGNIIISTPKLQILNGAAVTARNSGTNNAGNIEINANYISLNNAGEISASTFSGEGGNIIVNTQSLQLDQSQITASAGDSGNGGNVTINSDSILGIENSDITANAVGGNGGNITITSDAILGLEERSQLTPFGDITATSEFGVDGTVTINSPDIDFENEVFSAIIPSTPRKELRSLRRKCLNPRRREGKLLYIGRGGVPESPSTFFDDEEIIAIDEVSDKYEEKDEEPQVWKEGDPIIEPNTVVTATNGDVYLVAETRLDSKNTQANVCEVKIEEE